jgi:hypothetical protein
MTQTQSLTGGDDESAQNRKRNKRWTMEDDLFLHEFYETVGAYIGPHDLGRSEKATRDRVRHLKKCGAWDALTEYATAHLNYLEALAPDDDYWDQWRAVRGP